MSNIGSNCTIIRPMLEGYVLDMLTPAETVMVIQHLTNCPDCSAEVVAQRELLGKMPQMWSKISQLEASPALKENILDQIMNAARASPLPKNRTRSIKQWSLPMRSHGWQVAFWTAILLLAGLLAWGLDTNRQLSEERLAHEQLLAQINAQQDILNVVDSRQTAVQFLTPPEESENAPWGKFYSHPERRDVVIAGWHMPPLPPNHVYYAWLRSEEELILAGTMNVDTQGFGWVYFAGEQLPQSYEGVGFTMQPIGETESNRQGIIVWQAAQ